MDIYRFSQIAVEVKEGCDCLPKVVKKNPLNPLNKEYIFCTIYVYSNLPFFRIDGHILILEDL